MPKEGTHGARVGRGRPVRPRAPRRHRRTGWPTEIEERTGYRDPGDRSSATCSGAARRRRSTGCWPPASGSPPSTPCTTAPSVRWSRCRAARSCGCRCPRRSAAQDRRPRAAPRRRRGLPPAADRGAAPPSAVGAPRRQLAPAGVRCVVVVVPRRQHDADGASSAKSVVERDDHRSSGAVGLAVVAPGPRLLAVDRNRTAVDARRRGRGEDDLRDGRVPLRWSARGRSCRRSMVQLEARRRSWSRRAPSPWRGIALMRARRLLDAGT